MQSSSGWIWPMSHSFRPPNLEDVKSSSVKSQVLSWAPCLGSCRCHVQLPIHVDVCTPKMQIFPETEPYNDDSCPWGKPDVQFKKQAYNPLHILCVWGSQRLKSNSRKRVKSSLSLKIKLHKASFTPNTCNPWISKCHGLPNQHHRKSRRLNFLEPNQVF